METIKLIGRNSRLSLLQVEIVKQKIRSAFPNINVEVIERSSRGDVLQNVPLHTVEGSDFFTGEIFDALSIGEADPPALKYRSPFYHTIQHHALHLYM